MIDHVAIRIFVRLMRTSFSSLTSFINDIWRIHRFLCKLNPCIVVLIFKKILTVQVQLPRNAETVIDPAKLFAEPIIT